MANADFTPRQTQNAGGFDAGSYRAKEEPAAAQRSLTPTQQKIANLEDKLPSALRTRTVAVVASTVVIVVSVILCGGAKLRAKQKEAQTWYTVGITADNGYTMSEELNARSFAAANVITSASNTAGISEDSAELTAARTALETFDAYLEQMPDTGKMHEMYQANEALDAAIKQLYAKMQELAEDPFKMGAVQGQYGNFNSAGTILSSLHYNEAVAQYEKETGGALASVLKTLQGIKEVEAFA